MVLLNLLSDSCCYIHSCQGWENIAATGNLLLMQKSGLHQHDIRQQACNCTYVQQTYIACWMLRMTQGWHATVKSAPKLGICC